MAAIILSVLPVLIVIFVMRVASISVKKQIKDTMVKGNSKSNGNAVNNSDIRRPKSVGVSASMRGGTAGSAGVQSKGNTSVSLAMEDRQHDWLAKQLAEEKIAKKRMSEMFSLKQEHERDCDARQMRELHEKNCDAQGIDTAI